MALISKMPKIRVLKIHRPDGGAYLRPEGFKFLMKGLTYMH